MITDVSGVLLAGGLSRRMGKDKRAVAVDGETLFNRVLHAYEEVFTEIIIVVAEPSSITDGLSHSVVTDLIPQKGPMGGLYTGLSHTTKSRVFTAACDMPFLSVPLIHRLCEFSTHADVTMVHLDIGIQPMQSIYSKKCIAALRSLIDENQLEMRSILSQPELAYKIVDQKQIVDLDSHCVSFMNVNTPSDLEMANKLCRS